MRAQVAAALLALAIVLSSVHGISEVEDLGDEEHSEVMAFTAASEHSGDETMAMDEEAAFRDFTKLHKKMYESKNEYTKRFGVWKDNLKFVREWNAGGHSFQVGMNEFADLSDDEFAGTYLNPSINNEFRQSETFMAAEEEEKSKRMKQRTADTLVDMSTKAHRAEFGSEGGYDIRWHKNTGSQPKTEDWHAKGATTPVNNQAKCFACYAFAACGAIEGAKFINTGKMQRLSAQQIVDCSRTKYHNHGCKGGTMVKSYKYIINNGVMKWEDYGYNSLLNSRIECKTTNSQCKYNANQVQQRIIGYVNVRKGDEEDLKNAVGLRPVSVAIDAHHRAFKLYRSGIFSLASCTTHLTHGVLMVGYGEHEGKKFWKMKNSWGSTWGTNGYGHIIRGENMCSIADWSNYPILDETDKVSAVRSLAELGDPSGVKNAPWAKRSEAISTQSKQG